MANIRTVHISELKQDPENARRHNPRNVGQIERSISTDGFGRSGLLAEDLTIAAGNATADASVSAGMEEVVIVDSDGTKPIYVRRIDLKSGSPEFRRLAVSDNRAAELATWDAEVLQSFMDDGLDLEQFWFPDELADLLAGDDPAPGLTDPDAVPDVPDDPITKPGDVWLLGEHRVCCGDSTVVTDVDRLMQGRKASCIWTDPPYGVNYIGKTKNALTIQNDGSEGLAGLLHDAFTNATMVCSEGTAFYIARPAGALSVTFGNAILGAGWRLHEELQWVKDSMVLGHSDYHLKHETVVFGYLPGGGRRGRGGDGWYGDNAQTSVFDVARPKASPDHPTGKPVDLIAQHLGNSSKPGGLVLDLFGGSGSTLIAAEQTGRIAYLMELDPKYADVCVRRWESFTGQTATRETPALHDDTTHAKAAD